MGPGNQRNRARNCQ